MAVAESAPQADTLSVCVIHTTAGHHFNWYRASRGSLGDNWAYWTRSCQRSRHLAKCHEINKHRPAERLVPSSAKTGRTAVWYHNNVSLQRQVNREHVVLSTQRPDNDYNHSLSTVLPHSVSMCTKLITVFNSQRMPTNRAMSKISNMQSLLDQLLTWSDENNMQINSIKTKEMILGSASKRHWPSLTVRGTTLERVSVYKLLGVFISADLRWETHPKYIISKAVSLLHFL